MQATPVHLCCDCSLEHILLWSGAEMQMITIDLPFYTTVMMFRIPWIVEGMQLAPISWVYS